MIKKVKRPAPLEKETQNLICEWLDVKGFFFWRSNNVPVFAMSGSGYRTFRKLPKYTPKGLPDIIIVHHGKFIGVEVKREGMKMRPEQETFLKKVIANGGYYCLVHSLQDLENFLYSNKLYL